MSLQSASGQQREESPVLISAELVVMSPWHQLFTLTTNTEFCAYRAESSRGEQHLYMSCGQGLHRINEEVKSK